MRHALRYQQTNEKGDPALWNTPTMNRVLWVVQVCLAVFFLYGGAIKLVPPDTLPGAALLAALLSPLPMWFVDAIGIAEMLGALGLILPMRLGILPILTPLAAVGLIMVMIGASVFVVVYYEIAFGDILSRDRAGAGFRRRWLLVPSQDNCD